MTDTTFEASKRIYSAMLAVMSGVGAIEKLRRNQQQGFDFRGIDDVYASLHDLMAEKGVFMTSAILSERSEERVTKSGTNMIYRILHIRYRFTASDGSFVESEVIGESCDSGDKAANKAMSIGQKYSLLQTFLIPTRETKDPDFESHEPSVKKPRATPVGTKKLGDMIPDAFGVPEPTKPIYETFAPCTVCGGKMMQSKYAPDEIWCVKCKKKRSKGQEFSAPDSMEVNMIWDTEKRVKGE